MCDDHHSLASPELGNWTDLVIASARATDFPAFVRLLAVSALGGACICARRHNEPEVMEEREIVLGEDRERAALFVARTREKIVEEVKRTHQLSKRLEMHWYGDNSFYVKHHARICADLLQGAMGGKRAREGGDESRASERASKRARED